MTDQPQDIYRPAKRTPWGRVWLAAAIIIFTFWFGRCTAEGVPKDEVAQLHERIAALEGDNNKLQGRIDSLNEMTGGAVPEPVPTETEATSQPSEPAPDPEPEPEPEPDPNGPGGTYIVQTGDTLSSIAERFYGDTKRADDIAAANGMDPDDALQIGQELKLPPK